MAKAIKLNIDSDYDFYIVGLVTTEPIYRLSWLLNEAIETKFIEGERLKIVHKKTKEEQSFINFQYQNGDLNFHLVQNKTNQGFFIEEQKTIDYFLKISSNEIDLQQTLAKIKAIKNISLALSFEPGSLKSVSRFLSF